MFKKNAFIEFRYYSGGLKSNFTGADKRPDWLPDLDLVGLHNKVSPALGEYVVEFSRHKRGDKYITWIGVYSHGKDDQFGDRANYNGVGAWIVDAFPIHCSLIIKFLHEICDLLVAQGPNDNVKNLCKGLQEDLLFWISSMDLLPNLDGGILFDSTSHPETLYIRSENRNNEITFMNVASSIERNCIVADKELSKFSRFLYLLLDGSAELKNISNLISLPESYSPTEDLINYFDKASKTLKQDVEVSRNKINELESDISRKAIEINGIANAKLQLEQDNAQKAKKIEELELLSNTKSPKQLLDELKQTLIDISTDPATKEKLLKYIEDLDSLRPIKLEVPQVMQDYRPYLSDIQRRLDMIQVASNNNEIKSKKEPNFLLNNKINEQNSTDILSYIVWALIFILVVFGAWMGYERLFLMPELSKTSQVNIEIPQDVSSDKMTGKFTITAKPTVIKNLSEHATLTSNPEDTRVVYDVIFGSCKIADERILSASPDNNHEICKIKARSSSGEEALVSVDIDITTRNAAQKK